MNNESNTNPFGEGFKEADAGAFIYWKEATAKDDDKKCIPVGGSIKGTLTAVEDKESLLPGKEGVMELVYIIETEENDVYRIGSRGKVFDKQMSKVLIGQQVGFLYAEDIPSKTKGYSDFKLIKVYPGQMNPDFVVTPVRGEEVSEDNEPEATVDNTEPFKG